MDSKRYYGDILSDCYQEWLYIYQIWYFTYVLSWLLFVLLLDFAHLCLPDMQDL